jgi:hypothetical protein
MQMKQSGSANNSGGAPILDLDAWGGRWRLRQALDRTTSLDLRQLWSAPARLNFWTRFVFDVRYSDREKGGFIRVGADLNGDGDISDPGELSPGFRSYPQGRNARRGTRWHQGGHAIPSHLRTGLYHDTAIPCPTSTGCPVDVDNVRVLRP